MEDDVVDEEVLLQIALHQSREEARKLKKKRREEERNLRKAIEESLRVKEFSSSKKEEEEEEKRVKKGGNERKKKKKKRKRKIERQRQQRDRNHTYSIEEVFNFKNVNENNRPKLQNSTKEEEDDERISLKRTMDESRRIAEIESKKESEILKKAMEESRKTSELEKRKLKRKEEEMIRRAIQESQKNFEQQNRKNWNTQIVLDQNIKKKEEHENTLDKFFIGDEDSSDLEISDDDEFEDEPTTSSPDSNRNLISNFVGNKNHEKHRTSYDRNVISLIKAETESPITIDDENIDYSTFRVNEAYVSPVNCPDDDDLVYPDPKDADEDDPIIQQQISRN